MPGKSQPRTSPHVSLIAFSAASDVSQASGERAAKNRTFCGPSACGPHEDRDFFQAATFLLSQSIRGERERESEAGFWEEICRGPKNRPADE